MRGELERGRAFVTGLWRNLCEQILSETLLIDKLDMFDFTITIFRSRQRTEVIPIYVRNATESLVLNN